MIKLVKTTIHHYRCLAADVSLNVMPDITALIGKNEAGKTSVLKALAKANGLHIENTDNVFDPEKDFPKRKKRELDRAEEIPPAITLTYQMDDDIVKKIENETGNKIPGRNFDVTVNYKGEHILSGSDIDEAVYKKYLLPEIPKFLYYDEYNLLPERVSVEKLVEEKNLNASERTARALLLLADIDPKELVECEDIEKAKKELELVEAEFSDKFLKYWKNNPDLRIKLDIVRKEKEVKEKGLIFTHTKKVKETFLEVGIQNVRDMVALSFENRSKGFCWFFSFWVWFKAVQKEGAFPFILLLDEPGLSLHAGAQKDLMNLMLDISRTNQVIFTTHSPFMLENMKGKVMCVTSTDSGSVIRTPEKETDLDTLLPLYFVQGSKLDS